VWSQATHAKDSETWALDACVRGKQIAEAVYQKSGTSPDRYAKFDWQQLGCTWKVDRSAQTPLGVLTYTYALRRSDFSSSADAARKASAAIGLGASSYRLYFRSTEDKWEVVGYQSLGDSLSSVRDEGKQVGPVLTASDFKGRRAIDEIAIAAMGPVLGVRPNTVCAESEKTVVVCAPNGN